MEKITKVICGEYACYYLTDGNNVYTATWNQGKRIVDMETIGVPNLVDAGAGLHHALAVDASGNVHTLGDNTFGQSGNGTISPTTNSLFQIVKDAMGNPFTGIKKVWSRIYTNIAQKGDGSLWMWGQDYLSTLGGDAAGPKPIIMPAGATIVKVIASLPLLGLDSTGGVWQWDIGTAPTKVSLPGPATDIASCDGRCSIAIVGGFPYGWGPDGGYMGEANGVAVPNPIPLKDVWGMTVPITQIVANNNTFHFIDANSDLWGLGDNANGEVGNGEEINWATQNPPYAWNWGKYGLMVKKPVHIGVGSKFKQICGSNSAAFYKYAQDVNGNWFSWGRNKSLVLGNGEQTEGDIQSQFPNLLDVTSPTYVTPLLTPVVTLSVTVTNGIPSITSPIPAGPILPNTSNSTPPPTPPPATKTIISILITYSDGSTQTLP